MMAGVGQEGACQPARKPGQAAPAGEAFRRARGAAHALSVTGR